MRIRVRVTAPVETLRYVRRANGRPIRSGAKPEISCYEPKFREKLFTPDGVAHRLSGGAKTKAPAPPVNNAGKAIRASGRGRVSAQVINRTDFEFPHRLRCEGTYHRADLVMSKFFFTEQFDTTSII